MCKLDKISLLPSVLPQNSLKGILIHPVTVTQVQVRRLREEPRDLLRGGSTRNALTMMMSVPSPVNFVHNMFTCTFPFFSSSVKTCTLLRYLKGC